MALFEKLKQANAVMSFAEKIIRLAPVILGTAGMAWLSGWAGSVTAALAKYAPLSWVASGAAGGISFALLVWLWTATKLNFERISFARLTREKADDIDVMQDTFTRKKVILEVFRGLFNEPVRNKTFVDCELRGPAVICLVGCSLTAASGLPLSS